jgi:hypothetical protein
LESAKKVCARCACVIKCRTAARAFKQMSAANLHPILAICLETTACAQSLHAYAASAEWQQRAAAPAAAAADAAEAASLHNVHWHTPKMTSIAIYALGAVLLAGELVSAVRWFSRLAAFVRTAPLAPGQQ